MDTAFRYEVAVSIGSNSDLTDAEAETLRACIETAARGALGNGGIVVAVFDGRRGVRLALGSEKELTPAEQSLLAASVQDAVVDVLQVGEGVQIGHFVEAREASAIAAAL